MEGFPKLKSNLGGQTIQSETIGIDEEQTTTKHKRLIQELYRNSVKK
jgi:hypothetical protein